MQTLLALTILGLLGWVIYEVGFTSPVQFTVFGGFALLLLVTGIALFFLKDWARVLSIGGWYFLLGTLPLALIQVDNANVMWLSVLEALAALVACILIIIALTSKGTRSLTSSQDNVHANAWRSFRIIFTQPFTLIPILISLLVIAGIAFFGVFSLYMYTVKLSGAPLSPGDALTLAGVFAAQKGIWTWEFAGYAGILLVLFIAAAFVLAYAKAMLSGVVRDTLDGTKTNVISVFRAGRAYLRSNFFYTTIFALIAWIFILADATHRATILAGALGGIPAPAIEPAVIIQIIAGVAFIALGIFTIAAEGVIVSGGKAPFRESIAWLFQYPRRAFAGVGAAIVAVFIVYLLTLLSGILQALNAWTWLIIILFYVPLVLWRVWAIAFGTVVVYGRNQKERTPRA